MAQGVNFLVLLFVLQVANLVTSDDLENTKSEKLEILETAESSSNVAPSSRELPKRSKPVVLDIEDILRDIQSGLSKPDERDLKLSEDGKSESKPARTIVGVKRHKNYEIVLYEYPDDESLASTRDVDFDTTVSKDEVETPRRDNSRKRNGKHAGHRHRSRSRKKEGSDKTESIPTTNSQIPEIKLPKLPEPQKIPVVPVTPTPLVDDASKSSSPRPHRHKKRRKRPETKQEIQKPEAGDEILNSEIPARYEEYDYFSPNNSPRSEEYTLPESFVPEFGRKNVRPARPKPRGPSRFFNTYDFEDSVDPNERNNPIEFNPTPSPHKHSRKNNRTSIKYKNHNHKSKVDENASSGRGKRLQAPGAGKFVFRQKDQQSSKNNQFDDSFDDYNYDDDYNYSSDYEDDDEEKVIKCEDPTGKEGHCIEYFKCTTLFTASAGKINLQEYKCRLGSEIGICCPPLDGQVGFPSRSRNGRPLMRNFDRKFLSRQIRRLIKSNVNNSLSFGSGAVAQLEQIERDLLSRGQQVSKDSPAFGHNRFFPSSKRIRQVSDVGFELLQTTNDLSDRLRLTNEDGGFGLKNFKSSNTRAINDRCPRLPPCGINKYRLIDGSCNNLRRQKMGQSLTPLSRVLEPAYADGRWEPRISVRGFLLPSARLVSQTFIQDRDNPNRMYTLFVMQFGQFLDHDLSSVPIFTFANGTGISCCSTSGQFLPPPDRHPNCMPIEIPPDDPFYSRFGQRCMNFVRSRMAPRIDCSLGYADQMNAATHWLDLSNVYGQTESEMRDLRLFEGGLLQFSELADRKMLLPLKTNTASRELDYKAGDDRVNEMQGLMVMHLMWLREHNRVAIELQRLNPFWNDEQLYQEARRIVIAEFEHIVYNEWLPIIIGREYMDSYGIVPLKKKKFFKGYDPEIDASIESAFSSAAFRMGHSLVQGIVRLINEFGQSNEAATISNHAENAERTRQPNQIDKWIRGLAQMPIQSFDPFVTQHINGRLFQARGGMFGMDLSSLNVQRARDHGVPGYNKFRELCKTGKRAQKFQDFTDWIAPEIVENMRRIYLHPDDVDLWVGGISEAPLKGALVGPTFTCIIGDQFARTKKGDRYFYDIGDQTHSFSPEQLQEIRKVTLARILCDNSDNLEAIQPSVFMQADFDFNSLVDCRRSRRIPRVNLRLWMNEPIP